MNGTDPFRIFRRWYQEARDCGNPDPSVITLATATAGGKPSARTVLLKEFDAGGFVFYTNYGSRKARELDENPQAAMVIHWPETGYQVRIEGRVEKTSAEESDRYFASRPRGSQLGAWTSRQSRPIPSRESLESALRAREMEFRDREVPRPPHWGGYRLVPDRIEFWVEQENRLHDRVVYERKSAEGKVRWVSRRLAP